MGRTSILEKIAANILTGGRRTTAVNTREVLNEMADSYVSSIYDTAANFTSSNPVLETKQFGVETNDLTTAPKYKIGDGTTAWNSLPYANSGSGTPQTSLVSPDGNTQIEVVDGQATITSHDLSGNYGSDVITPTSKTTNYTDGTDTIEVIQTPTTYTKNGVEIATVNDIGTWAEATSTISGDTHTLAHTYTRGQGFYMNGQRLFVGGSIVSIVGTLVTFDQDYTGEKFTETGYY